ncbi:hypothetical protein DCC78_08340 [bacterium]|nr:MAG: hypothetical protein DCC78_08340 [bacterium]
MTRWRRWRASRASTASPLRQGPARKHLAVSTPASTRCLLLSGTMTTTPSSTACRRGDIFFVNVRFSDGTGTKRRPAVVVSVAEFHMSRADALIVPLTTNLRGQRFGDYLLQDWEAARLPRPSLAKGVVETVERSAFDGQLGQLTPRDLTGVEEALRQVLGL